MIKKFLLVFLCLSFITGCHQKQARELNILNWSSYIPDSILRSFEDETGIKLNYGTYSSNEECLAKVQSSKEGTFDLIFPSDYMIELMIKRGLIEKLDKSKLKNLGNLNTNYLNMKYDPNNEYSIPFLTATTVIAVNREHIQDEIRSYNDLLNKKYKNNLIILDDQRIIIGMALQALGYSMNETDNEKLKEAKNWLLELKKNIKAFDSDSPKTFLISGEVDIGVLWNAEAALAKIENPNIEIIYPEEGLTISIDNFALPKGSKNKDYAYQFIDYILRPEVMKQIIEDYPYKNINQKTEAMLSHSYLENPASNIPDKMIRNGEFVENIGSFIREYDKLWAEIK